MAGGAGTELSRGGMVTKIEAGKIATAAGTDMVITAGTVHASSARALRRRALHLVPRPIGSGDARKRWIAGQLEPKGSVEIDAGAVKALLRARACCRRASRRVEGTFERGDAVDHPRPPTARELGRGLIAYARADAARIIGRKSGEIDAILGYAGRTELVHRDDMVLSRS